MTLALPVRWQVVLAATPANDPRHPSVEGSLTLLQQTHPGRYTNLAPNMLRSKMGDRQHTSGDKFPGLRIFSRMTNGVTDITAFYFLRLRFCPQAFVLTMGTSITDDQVLYDDVKQIAKIAQTHPKVPRIEIINLQPLPGDLSSGTAGAQAIGRAFSRGITATTIQADDGIHLGRPWRTLPDQPVLFNRWFIAQIP